MPQCEKCWKPLGIGDETKLWNIQLKDGYINEPQCEDGYTTFTGMQIAFPKFKGKLVCKNCALELIKSAGKGQQAQPLLKCKNAFLTDTELHYDSASGRGSNKRLEHQVWIIANMSMAMMQDNGSLRIIFKDGAIKDFNLGIDNSTKASAAGLALFGGVGTIIAGSMAIDNQIKARTQQWVTAINALISKDRLPPMIYCRYCGTKSKSTEPKCLHCGAILQ